MAGPAHVISIETVAQARNLEAQVLGSALRATRALEELVAEETGIHALYRLKFEPAGFDPLDEGRSLNLIEQINQSFTILVSLRAVELLLHAHPAAAPYRLNLGARSGWDIESHDGSVVAETFAAVSPNNNYKLTKDVAKLAGARALYRYVIYSSAQPGRDVTAPGVSVRRIEAGELLRG